MKFENERGDILTKQIKSLFYLTGIGKKEDIVIEVLSIFNKLLIEYLINIIFDGSFIILLEKYVHNIRNWVIAYLKSKN
ncbi:hypothetical protein ABZ40_14880 [Listeria monocytogenes]|nr:hypothetical protein [Listeria monocytogenes]